MFVVAKQADNKIIVSRVVDSNGSVYWTYALNFTYSEPPMLIAYQNSGGKGYHTLATKVSGAGFALAWLKIDNGNVEEMKQATLT